MKEWDETSINVSKITPDIQKAKALLKLINLREKSRNLMTKDMTTLIIEGYYKSLKN